MKFKNYHLKEQYPEGFTSTQPHRPRLEAIESEGKEGIWVGSACDKKFFKKEDYRFLYELFRELVEKGIEPLTDDLMHKDEISRLEQEIAALREKNEQQADEIERLRGEVEDWRSGIVNAMGETPCRDASEHHCSCVPYLRREIAALREAVRVLNTASKCDMCDGQGWYIDCGAYGENPVQYQCFGCCGSGWRGAERVLYHPAVRRALEEER